ncbi:MAG TPA: helix-turn-helix transcriptional regulator [Micromonosporaceae bacterium]
MPANSASGTTGGDRDLAGVGALVADRARCRMLVALADGRSLPAGRLAIEADVSAATASSHLSKLVAGGLLMVDSVGRSRQYRLAGPDVADLLEALERLAPALAVRSLEQSRQTRAWRQARVCYDHVAGALGVDILQVMLDRGHITPDRSRLTDEGSAFLTELGVVVPASRQPVRHHADSTEGRPHLSGAVGRGLLTRFVALGWLERRPNQRLHLTDDGRQGFANQFSVEME